MALTLEQQRLLGEYFSLTEDKHKPLLQSIKIDNVELSLYATYSFFNARSYETEPERTAGGVIDNLNSIPTFKTPRLRINFSIMPISTYRTLMKLLDMKNEHIVECYDIVKDDWVIHKMYFYPDDFPELFTYDLYLLGVINYTIELVGTNADLDKVSVIYHLNPPEGYGSDITVGSDDIPQGSEFIVGEGTDFQTETFNGNFKFVGWTDSNDIPYLDNVAYNISSDLVLYAKWRASTTYTLSYNYGLGETYINPQNNNPLYSKEVNYGDMIGFLPTTPQKKVTYNNQEYEPYTFRGWFKTPQITTGSEALFDVSIYNANGNTTIYQIYTPSTYLILFDSRGGNYTPTRIVAPYGSAIAEPSQPTREGYTFKGWKDMATGNDFAFTTMPPTNVTLYASWEKNE